MSISTPSLIQLCHRVGMAVRSGVDARRVWEMEERHANGQLKSAIADIRRQVAAGGTVAEAMQAQNGYFPPMFVQMVAVGEQTGKLDEVLARLADHYQHVAQMRRSFWLGIAWPLFSLVFGIVIIGALIFVTGMIAASQGGEPLDLLGLGLTGVTGAILWFLMWGLAAAAIFAASYALIQGWLGPGPMLAAMRIPILGQCLESTALSRLTWSLAVALESGMDARRAVDMSIQAAQNPYYESGRSRVTAGIRANRQFHESFSDGQVFPSDFIAQVEVAEEAGATTESLMRLAKEYEDRARTAMRTLTGIAVGAVMLIYFGLFAMAIFSIAYQALIQPLNEAQEMLNSGRI